MRMPRPVRVVGVGSPSGDDAVGWAVIEGLKAKLANLPDIELHAVAGGPDLLDLMDGRGTLILVDAVRAGEAPGTVHVLDWPDGRVEALRPGSTHHLRPAEALRLADTLNLLPARVTVIGIEAECLEVGAGLSPAVAAAVPDVVNRITAMLTDGDAVQSPG